MMAAVSISGVSIGFGPVTVIDDLSLDIPTGTTFGVVGESGSGKTTLLRAALGLQGVKRGDIRLMGERFGTSLAETRRRARIIQPIFQDPAAALSPRCRIGVLMDEVATVLGEPRDSLRQRLDEILRRLGLPRAILDKYPHQISGGQARRAAIARALLMRPRILAADEPTAGLDVSVQGELLNLLQELRRTEDITLLIITHNLAVVRLIADRVAVMQSGRIVEEGEANAVFARPRHAYTRELINSWPASS
ncbi:MAG: ABC transporter ATP-binding protein [Pseudomonadota bacterium]